MSVLHLVILIVFCFGMAFLFGWLWLAMRAGKLWGTIGYIVLALMDVVGSGSMGSSAFFGAVLGLIIFTAMGALMLKGMGYGRKAPEGNSPAA